MHDRSVLDKSACGGFVAYERLGLIGQEPCKQILQMSILLLSFVTVDAEY
jgi:hypothetical protein